MQLVTQFFTQLFSKSLLLRPKTALRNLKCRKLIAKCYQPNFYSLNPPSHAQ
jgi:hypothetical protein